MPEGIQLKNIAVKNAETAAAESPSDSKAA